MCRTRTFSTGSCLEHTAGVQHEYFPGANLACCLRSTKKENFEKLIFIRGTHKISQPSHRPTYLLKFPNSQNYPSITVPLPPLIHLIFLKHLSSPFLFLSPIFSPTQMKLLHFCCQNFLIFFFFSTIYHHNHPNPPNLTNQTRNPTGNPSNFSKFSSFFAFPSSSFSWVL